MSAPLKDHGYAWQEGVSPTTAPGVMEKGGGTWPEWERSRHAIECFLRLHPDHEVANLDYQLFALKTAAPRRLRTAAAAACRRFFK
jgi:hypothetical protein